MLKYKDYRCVLEMTTLSIILVAVSFYLGFHGVYGLMILGFVIAVVCAFAVSLSYNNMLDDEEVTYYKWYVFIAWTATIAYNQLARIEVTGKHTVTLTPKDRHQKKIKVSVFDPEGFAKEAKSRRAAYINAGKRHR